MLFLILSFSFILSGTQAQITSTFDTDDEGWTAIDNQAGPLPAYVNTGGNPGGFIRVEDGVQGTATYFAAPDKFLGNRSDYYGGTLQFDLQVYSTPNSSTAGVRLTGGGLVLARLLPQLPAVAPAWTSYTFILSEDEAWRLNSPAGNIATQA
ncbi:MAG TPA: laminin B domain-containing protein, partial [Cyclobacteriaceae bacterium]|nr:laminin B domain-containing protein [Cyclobacteriaceae bacterium]